MIPLRLHLDVDRAPIPADVTDRLIGDLGTVTDVALLRNGTARGRAVVAFVITLPDGRTVLGQTTWALLRTAYRALEATPIVAEEVIDP